MQPLSSTPVNAGLLMAHDTDQPWLGGLLIVCLERLGSVRNVRRPSPEMIAERRRQPKAVDEARAP